VRWLGDLWRSQSLRAHITVAATVLFAIAVLSGAVLLIALQRLSLVRLLDGSADSASSGIATLVHPGATPRTLPSSGGVDRAQVVDANDVVIANAPGTDAVKPLLSVGELARARGGHRVTVSGDRANSEDAMRITAVAVDDDTVLVGTGLGRVDESVHSLRSAALVGCPIAVLAMGLATYFIVGRTLRPVAGLRRGAEAITAAGLADQRLPVSDAQDEIHRLAVTLNAMLDRIDLATKRQRTFVGDAAHELRSPLASLKVQLEVAERLGPATDWPAVLSDAMVDVSRLDRLVDDLLALARFDEGGGNLRRREPIDLDGLVASVVGGYEAARVPVETDLHPAHVEGDPDALRRVVINLVDNAVRYAASGVQVSVVTDGDSIELTVADDGPGIPVGERELVFDRFYRVNASRSRETGGTGLGLPIVRDLVHLHGGLVGITQNDPTGAKAIVTLPAS
jgi:signal transduction histidine kinase